MPSDIQSRIILIISSCLAIICLSFGSYRALTGEYSKVIILIVTLLFTASIIFLILKRYEHMARIAFILLMYSVLIVINVSFMSEQILWHYPGIVAMTFALRGYKEVLIICTSLVAINTVILSRETEANVLMTYAGSQVSLIVLCALIGELIMSNIKTAQKDALTDGLTGLLNRKAFDHHVTELYERSKGRKPSVLLLIDVDHFKSINDTYGHVFGDLALKTIASTINTSIREQDIGFRYGGEEFAVLLPDTTLLSARLVAERIRMNIEKTIIENKENRLVSCTASIGLATSRVHKANDWIELCDNSLYDAKRTGRNRICYTQNELDS